MSIRMSTRNALVVAISMILLLGSESAPRSPSSPRGDPQDGSGELPQGGRNPFRNDENNVGSRPLFEEDFERNDFGLETINPAHNPLDYEYGSPGDNDYVRGFRPGMKPEIKPEILPDVHDDERPFVEPDYRDEGNDVHRQGNGETDGDGKSRDRDHDDDSTEVRRKDDEDESGDKGHPKFDENDDVPKDDKDEDAPKIDEDEHVPKDNDEDGPKDNGEDVPKEDEDVPKEDEDVPKEGEDLPKDNGEDVPKEDEDVPKDDEKKDSAEDEEEIGDAEESSSFHGGLFFDTPFFNVRQVTKYFQQLEKALEHVFRETMDEAVLLNGTYANTTEEEVEIDGKKYIVQKSVIQGKENNSSIYIEALSKSPKNNETTESKDSGL